MPTSSARPQTSAPNSPAALCESLRQAIETRNAADAAALYSDDAELIVVNRNYPPSHPMVRHGRAAVAELYRDVCAREMTHKIIATVVGNNAFAMQESCLYPDGCRVVGHVIAHVQDGRIVRQTNVDAWDE
jgi:hypothetical protein